MLGKEIKLNILLAAFIVPTQNLQDWTVLTYNKIPSNEVKIEQNSLVVKVNQSASPIVYKLPEIKKVNSFSFKVQIQGSLNEISKSQTFPEDSYVRLGLVAKGDKKLNWFQRKIAANWVLKLFELAPTGVGLDKIYFYNLGTRPDQIGKVREHPKSELIVEEIILVPENKKELTIQHKLTKPLEVVAIWISIDGDDTKSSYVTTLKDIQIE